MNRKKCPACGLIVFSNEESCQRCKKSFVVQDADSVEYSPWIPIVVGLIMILGAFFMYRVFDQFEKEGGSVRINWLVALLYQIGGKWAVSILMALMGIFITSLGFSPHKPK